MSKIREEKLKGFVSVLVWIYMFDENRQAIWIVNCWIIKELIILI